MWRNVRILKLCKMKKNVRGPKINLIVVQADKRENSYSDIVTNVKS